MTTVADSWRSEYRSLQLQSPTAADDYEERVFGFVQNVYPVIRIQMPRIRVRRFRNPKRFGPSFRSLMAFSAAKFWLNTATTEL